MVEITSASLDRLSSPKEAIPAALLNPSDSSLQHSTFLVRYSIFQATIQQLFYGAVVDSENSLFGSGLSGLGVVQGLAGTASYFEDFENANWAKTA